jgi:hypothetical protein
MRFRGRTGSTLVAARATFTRKLWRPRHEGSHPLAWVALAVLAAALAGCSSGHSIPAPKKLALVYRSRGQLVLAAPDGAGAHVIGPAAQALLSPDGTRVAALSDRRGRATLTVYRTGRVAHASSVAQLGPPGWAGQGATLLAWSADSRFVALSADVLSASGEQGALVTVNVASGHVTTIATGNFLGASFSPSLPDKLVYARASLEQLDDNESLLYVASPDGRGTRTLTHSGLASAPAWSLRGIVFAKLLALGSATSSPDYGLALIQPNGSGLHRIGDFAAGAPAGDSALLVSASGTHLLADFDSPHSPSPLIDVWKLNLAARHPVAEPLRQPGALLLGDGVSRNGKTLLLSAIPLSGKPEQVESIPFSGGPPKVLATTGTAPSWNH